MTITSLAVVEPNDCAAALCRPNSEENVVDTATKEEDETSRIDFDCCLGSSYTDITEATTSSESSYSSCCLLGEDSSSSCYDCGDHLPSDFLGHPAAAPSTAAAAAALNTPPPPQRRSKKKRLLVDLPEDSLRIGTTTIRFAAEIQYQDVLHILDYSPHEKSACWYTVDECSETRTEAQDLIDLLECGESIPEEMMDLLPSPRGLETFMEQGARASYSHYRLGAKAVFDEQARQALAGIYDATAIAKQYRKVTLRSRFPARNMALKDQDEADKCS